MWFSSVVIYSFIHLFVYVNTKARADAMELLKRRFVLVEHCHMRIQPTPFCLSCGTSAWPLSQAHFLCATLLMIHNSIVLLPPTRHTPTQTQLHHEQVIAWPVRPGPISGLVDDNSFAITQWRNFLPFFNERVCFNCFLFAIPPRPY